ncbi:MAG: threonine--tRNA ligase [Candidatus Paceibacterota bacterium]|jgi:threonyl-tRNA synthetase
MNNEDKLYKIRHSLAHLLGAAVLNIWPEAKIATGPAIDNGFYYDFEFPAPISDKDLGKVEQKMHELLKKWESFEKTEISEKDAKKLFAGNPYKLELIGDYTKDGQVLTTYTSGEFTDLCAGPHVNDIKDIPKDAFKLERIAGAYWKGDEKNKMLTRIYGLAFASKDELVAYEKQQEEARARDHKKLGKELGLFVFSDLVGPGLPMYTFKGASIRKEIINYSNELQQSIGYQEVHTPNINKAELFKVSGHYEKYKEDMIKVMSNYSKEEYFLKPMNCPQHTQIYASQSRSYRDLPIRIADFANLYRDERPGELNGLARLRCFCQDDAHAFCREDQIKEEFINVLGIIKKALVTYKMDYKIRLSLWDPAKPEKYLGDAKVWERAQKLLRELLEENKIEHIVAVGEAAIYGPKMDIMTKDSLGREWQISTIQLDLIMPERFKLTYSDKDGKEKTPVMIHRAIIGSPERFMGILIEHYAGAFPLWLAPVQVKIVPVRENHNEYAEKISAELKTAGFRVDCDTKEGNMGGKVRDAKNNKVPYTIIVGDKDISANKITVENRDKGALGQMDLKEFIEKVKKEREEKV